MRHSFFPSPVALAVVLALGCAPAARALELAFPGPAEKTAERAEAFGSLRLPMGPFAAGSLPTQLAEGALSITAFRLGLDQISTLEVMQGLQDQITAAKFEVLFTCETEACGGYDFRYGAEVLPEPDMHVNLGDFRYLLARSANGAFVALLVSRTGTTGFVQVTRLGKAVPVRAASTSVARAPAAEPEAPRADQTGKDQTGKDLIAGVEAGRAVVLEDLVFASGSSALVAGDYSSLLSLAGWLQANPARKVVLVGHTDASGTLDGNIRLSRLRAESVRQELLYAHRISPDQIEAEGVGFLSPRAGNQTEAGRQKNRRVEVMATSTDLLAP